MTSWHENCLLSPRLLCPGQVCLVLIAMSEGEEAKCVHCKSQCWVEGGLCQEINKTRVTDCMDGFFVRLLILDDIKENQKDESDSRSKPVRVSHTPERSFNLRPPR